MKFLKIFPIVKPSFLLYFWLVSELALILTITLQITKMNSEIKSMIESTNTQTKKLIQIINERYRQSKILIEKLNEDAQLCEQMLNECNDILKFSNSVEEYINLNINKEIEISYKGEVRKIIPASWKNEKLIYATCLKDNHIKCFNIQQIILV